MMPGDPGLGAQVLEHDPQRRSRARANGFHILSRQSAAKTFNDHIAGILEFNVRCPGDDFYALQDLAGCIALQLRPQHAKRLRLIDPHAHLMAVLAGKLQGQTPANCGIAEVIDYFAENVIAHKAD